MDNSKTAEFQKRAAMIQQAKRTLETIRTLEASLMEAAKRIQTQLTDLQSQKAETETILARLEESQVWAMKGGV